MAISNLPAFLLRFGPRGDAFFSLAKSQGSPLDEGVAFLKFDRSMKEWSEVHFHCPEGEDVEQVTVKAFMKFMFFWSNIYF